MEEGGELRSPGRPLAREGESGAKPIGVVLRPSLIEGVMSGAGESESAGESTRPDVREGRGREIVGVSREPPREETSPERLFGGEAEGVRGGELLEEIPVIGALGVVGVTPVN